MHRGRPPSAKTLVDRQLGRNVPHPILPAGDTYRVPNHSGDHSEGRVDRTPTQDLDLVNKKFVDDGLAAIVEGLWETSAGNVQLITPDDILMTSATRIFFRDTSNSIRSAATGNLTTNATTTLDLQISSTDMITITSTLVTVGLDTGDTEIGGSILRVLKPQTTLKVDLGNASNQFNDMNIGGDVVMMPNLPTSDPGSTGALWVDSGTVKRSA